MKPRPNTQTDLQQSKISTTMNEIQLYTQQLKRGTTLNHTISTNTQLIQQNKRILEILKKIETKIDKQLETQKKQMLSTNPHHKPNFNKDQFKVLQQSYQNNTKLLTVLQKDLQNIMSRKKLHQNNQLQQKVRDKKNLLQDKITEIKLQLKKLSTQQKSQQKKLASYQNLSQTDYLKQYIRMQQQLRIYSAKYVKSLARYTKVTQQLAVSSNDVHELPFQIPQQIYSQLDEKQQQQYKQYQSIVKLCGILAKRNDSQNNKGNRIYTQKLKQLQSTILSLTQIQNAISIRQRQILQGKKNVQMIKYKLVNQQRVDKELFQVSNYRSNDVGMRQKSYSSVKLFNGSTNTSGEDSSGNVTNRLRARGLSFAKLPTRLKG